jgi:hypothetical protein
MRSITGRHSPADEQPLQREDVLLGVRTIPSLAFRLPNTDVQIAQATLWKP